VAKPLAEGSFALQPALAIRGELRPRLIDRAPKVDAAQDIVELPCLRPRVAHVVRHDGRDAELRGELGATVAAIDIRRPPAIDELGIQAIPEDLAQPRERLGVIALRERDEPRGLIGDEGEGRPRLRLLSRELGRGHDAAEAGPAASVEREERHRVGVDEPQLGTEDRLDAALTGHVPESHRAVQPARVGERERVLPVLDRRVQQVTEARCAVQEGVAAMRVEVDEAGHRSVHDALQEPLTPAPIAVDVAE